MTKSQKTKFNIIMIVAIVLLTIATVPKTLQEDTYYMIKVGEYICENGMQVIADKIEPFAWVEGITYTYPHWLLDVVFYQIYNNFDFAGIYVFSVISGIIIYLLIYLTNIKVSKNHVISAIITIVSIYFLSGFITARAQVITFICLILEVLFIEKFLETRKKRYAVGLILDPILLANCHAALFPMYFVIFMPYIVAYMFTFLTRKDIYGIRIKILKRKISKLDKNIKANKYKEKKINTKKEKLARKEILLNQIEKKLDKLNQNKVEKQRTGKIIIERNKNTKWLIVIFIICIFTGLLTPLGDIPYTYMIKSIQGNTMNYISEHQPVTLIYDTSLVIMFVVIAVLLFSNKIKIKLCDLFMLVGMVILSLISYKQFPIFFIGVMCIINKLALMLINKIKEDRKRKKEESLLESNEKEIVTEEIEISEELYEDEEKVNKEKITKKQKLLKMLKAMPYKILTVKGVVYTSLVIVIISMLQYRSIAVQSYVDTNSYPTLAVEWLKENVDIENMRLFNDFNYGSYLLFEDIPVFIDGRADVYDPVFNGKEDDVYLDYMQASSLSVWYQEVFDKYDITHIITYTSSNLNTYILRNVKYKQIYDDGTFVIYEVRDI